MPAFNIVYVITKVAFGLALVGYVILGATLIMMSGFVNSAREGHSIAVTMLCGGIYIIGSLFAIGDRLSATAMAVAGLILNLIGAAFWVPTIGSNEQQFAVIGASLSLLWFICVVLKYSKTKSNLKKQAQRMRSFPGLLFCISLIGCAVTTTKELGYTPQPGFKKYQQEEYLKGKSAAKADLKRGVLRFEDINGGEEERWQVIWCYRKILKERYRIEYRCHGTLPGPIAYAAGYQCVVRPTIEARLGNDWETRVFREAEVFHRKHWSEVVDQYRQEQWSGD